MAEEIMKVIDELAERFGVVIDWTSENVMPQVIELYERFITYSLVINTVSVVICLVFIFGFVKLVDFMVKERRKVLETNKDGLFFDRFGDLDCAAIPLLILAAIISVTCAVILWSCVGDIIKLLTIPELYVAQYFDLL